jgi:ferredoxin--NADP+ reductase
MKLLVEDLKEVKNNGDISGILPANKFVSQTNWEAINAAEVAAGEPLGKPRRKAVTREELLSLGGI